MNTSNYRKLATVGAAAALSLSLLAGVANAAIPSASPAASAFGDFSGDGWAGFSATLTYTDTSTASKLYFESDIVTNPAGNASVATINDKPVINATKNGAPISGCSVQDAVPAQDIPLSVKCLFKTIRSTDVIQVDFAVQPTASALSVSTEAKWGFSGYVPGTNNSHGDYYSAGSRTSIRTGNQDTAAGWGNTNLSTYQTVDKTTNPQAVRLAGLPAGTYSKVNDNAPDSQFTCVDDASLGIDCSKTSGSWIAVNVGNGGPYALFQIQVTYPSGTNAPKGFVHVFDNGTEEFIGSCAKNNPTYPCFTWTRNTNTANIFTNYNGGVRRT